jgi:hypothetical protein
MASAQTIETMPKSHSIIKNVPTNNRFKSDCLGDPKLSLISITGYEGVFGYG